jgi:hypothetical protein
MGSTVDHIECGDRQDVGRLDACKLSKVLINGNTLLA